MRIIVALALVTAACGDNGNVTPDAPVTPRCEPTPGPLPMPGPLADPLALPLPASCVVGGLDELPGRWFVADPDAVFTFFYPKFEGNCTDGFRRANYVAADDHDLADDNFTFHTWSDGTRIYYRYYFRFEIEGQPPFEFARAFAACLLPDGKLAAVDAGFDTDRGERIAEMQGERFGLKDGPANGLVLVGALGMRGPEARISAYNVAVDGDHAYVVGPGGFDVIDVSNPAAPTHVAHVEGGFNDVKVLRTAGKVVAYVSPLDNENTRVIDVTDPTAPTLAPDIAEYSHSVFVDTSGATPALYLATYSTEVPKYDVTVPLAPVRLGAAPIAGEEGGVHDLFAQGTRIYANNTSAGLVVLDTTTGLANAVELGRTPAPFSHASWAGTAGGRSIVLHGDEGMTGTPEGGAHLRVLDGDPASRTFLADIGRYQSRPQVGIHNFQLVGDRVYIAYYQDGVRVVDLSDPTQPTEIAHYNTWDVEAATGGPFEGALGIRVVGDLVYVADSARGLLILRAPQ